MLRRDTESMATHFIQQLASVGLTAAATMVLSSSAGAQSFNVDFSVRGLLPGGSPPSASFAAAGLPGVWNDFTLGFDGLPAMKEGLREVGGAISGVNFSYGPRNLTASSNSIFVTNGPGPGFSDIESLIGDGRALLEPGELIFEGLLPGTYDVLVYTAVALTSTTRVIVDVLDSPDPRQLIGGQTTANGPLIQGVTHSFHRTTVQGSGRLRIHTDVASGPDWVSGVQLIRNPSGTIGSAFCAASPNSTGTTGTLAAFGSDVAFANEVTLVASDLPPGQFGIFLGAPGTGPGVQVGSGTLCLAGPIGRFIGPGQIFMVSPGGNATITPDLTAIPGPMGTSATAPGDQWSFQAWHRDPTPSGPGSNFTAGVEIQFR